MTKSSAKSSEAKITRIKASDAASKKKPAKTPSAHKRATHTDGAKPKKANVLRAIGRYFSGSWVELRQVRWPDRRATWGMTGALLAFTAFFVVVILLLDAGFKYLFKLVIGG